MSSIPTPVMATPPYLLPFEFDSSGYYQDDDGDFSSGYLEDALLKFGDRSKRRRLSFSSSDRAHPLASGTGWDDTPSQNQQHHGSTRIDGLTEFAEWVEEETTYAASESEIQTVSEDAMSSLSSLASVSGVIVGHETVKRKPPRVIKWVSYPFALVKPGGSEDDVTLEDINARILMTPVRPLRHPVGEFACRPYDGGPGLSGKAVVGLTRLHTRGGKGSITIIRTKG